MVSLDNEKLLIEIVRCALHGEICAVESLSDEIGVLAQKHRLFNLLYLGTGNERAKRKYKEFLTKSAAQQDYFEKLTAACEAAGVELLPLKGICTKFRFPRPELRSMDDIDVLCKPEQKKQLHAVFETIGYDRFIEGRKHDSYTLFPFVAVETHRQLVDENERYIAYYQDIWQKVTLREGYHHIYEMSLEDEYIFNIVHLADHFQNGGAGIRFFTDIYVYERLKKKDEYLESELKKLKLFEFYQKAKELAFHWFGTDEERACVGQTPILEQMEVFVLTGGLYGDKQRLKDINASAGKINALGSAVFPPYHSMQSMFPWLKTPLLLPWAWLVRGIKMLKNRRANIQRVWDNTTQGDKERGISIKQFYANCGLQESGN